MRKVMNLNIQNSYTKTTNKSTKKSNWVNRGGSSKHCNMGHTIIKTKFSIKRAWDIGD